MPALVNSKVGSLPGTSGLEGTISCPLLLKKSRKLWRISALLRMVVVTGGGIRTRPRTTGQECLGSSDQLPSRADRDRNLGYGKTAPAAGADRSAQAIPNRTPRRSRPRRRRG